MRLDRKSATYLGTDREPCKAWGGLPGIYPGYRVGTCAKPKSSMGLIQLDWVPTFPAYLLDATTMLPERSTPSVDDATAHS